jgi:MYXO-CTERM domain-containing protein
MRKTKGIRFLITTLGAAMLALAWATPSQAIVFSGSSGTLSASADFELSGNTLTVTLTNTSPHDVLVPTDVLTAVFFNTTTAMTPLSANLNGSSVFYGSIVNNVGEGWQFDQGTGAHGLNSGIGASGFNVFGSDPWFFNPGQPPIDGLNYGILSAGDNPATGNTGVTGHGPLIKNSVQFLLTVGSGFSLAELGGHVVFQYGTALSEPNFPGFPPGTVPEPSSLAIAGLGALGLVGFGLRRRRAK